MARLNPVTILFGAMVLFSATGCVRREVALSPDAKLLAIADADGVVFRDPTGKLPDRVAKLPVVGSPSFSPDGKLIAVDQTLTWKNRPSSAKGGGLKTAERTVILGVDGNQKFVVPYVGGPYAWRPDGSELVGISGKTACVIHVASRVVVRKYPLSSVPDEAIWLGQSRNLGFTMSDPSGDSKFLAVLQDGVTHQLKLPNAYIGALGYDRDSNRILWSEEFGSFPKASTPLNNGYEVWSSDLSLGHPRRLIARRSAAELLGASAGSALPVILSISPDGKQIVATGVIDASRPGLMDKFVAMGGFSGIAFGGADPKHGWQDWQTSYQGISKQRRQDLERLAKQLRIRVVCSTMPIGPATPAATRRFASNLSDSVSAEWSGNGHDLVILKGEKVVVVPPLPGG